MILAGPKSYYDDYVRKQGTGRTLNDPPSLLTDRGAYVNFLEVQLERVSAACLGVQSYEQRFNDMQGLIVSLEERCGQTTRLLALSQQCIEEIRSEADNKIHNITREVKDEHREMQKSFEAMSCRIGIAERSIASMAGLQPQIEILEKRISNDANNMNIQANKNEERHQVIQERILVMTENTEDLSAKLEKTNTFASKLGLEVDENERKSNNMLSSSELRLHNTIVSDRDDMTKKLQTIQARITSETDRLQKDVTKRDMNNTSNARHQLEEILERIENTKKSTFEEFDRKCSRILESTTDDSNALKQKVKNQISMLETSLEDMNKFQQNQLSASSSGSLDSQLKSLTEGISNLGNQQKITSNELEIMQEAITTIVSNTDDDKEHRSKKEIEHETNYDELLMKFKEVSEFLSTLKVNKTKSEAFPSPDRSKVSKICPPSQSPSSLPDTLDVDVTKVLSKEYLMEVVASVLALSATGTIGSAVSVPLVPEVVVPKEIAVPIVPQQLDVNDDSKASHDAKERKRNSKHYDHRKDTHRDEDSDSDDFYDRRGGEKSNLFPPGKVEVEDQRKYGKGDDYDDNRNDEDRRSRYYDEHGNENEREEIYMRKRSDGERNSYQRGQHHNVSRSLDSFPNPRDDSYLRSSQEGRSIDRDDHKVRYMGGEESNEDYDNISRRKDSVRDTVGRNKERRRFGYSSQRRGGNIESDYGGPSRDSSGVPRVAFTDLRESPDRSDYQERKAERGSERVDDSYYHTYQSKMNHHRSPDSLLMSPVSVTSSPPPRMSFPSSAISLPGQKNSQSNFNASRPINTNVNTTSNSISSNIGKFLEPYSSSPASPLSQSGIYRPSTCTPEGPNASPGTVSTATGISSKYKDDPVREVLSKFLDIYQTDQDEIKQRYSLMNPNSTPNPTRFRLQRLSDQPLPVGDNIEDSSSDQTPEVEEKPTNVSVDTSGPDSADHKRNKKKDQGSDKDKNKENKNQDDHRGLQSHRDQEIEKKLQKRDIERRQEQNQPKLDNIERQNRANELYERYGNNENSNHNQNPYTPSYSSNQLLSNSKQMKSQHQDRNSYYPQPSGITSGTAGHSNPLSRRVPWVPNKSVSPGRLRDDRSPYRHYEDSQGEYYSSVAANSYRNTNKHLRSKRDGNLAPVSSSEGVSERRRRSTAPGPLYASAGQDNSDDDYSVHTTTATSSTSHQGLTGVGSSKKRSSIVRLGSGKRSDSLVGAAARMK